MARKVLDKSIPVSLESARIPGTFNEYASLPFVKKLAEVSLSSTMVFDAVTGFIVKEAKGLGYANEQLGTFRNKLLHCRPLEAAKEAIRLFEELSCRYTADLTDPNTSDEQKKKLRDLVSAGIIEAIINKCLEDSGRRSSDVTKDARVYTENPTEPLNKCNIDFVWAAIQQKAANIYEFKNHPGWLFGKYGTRDDPGNVVAWKKSKLWLMLELYALLVGAGWSVDAGCVTLRKRETLKSMIASHIMPKEVTLYCREDIGNSFPPSL